MTVTAEEYRAAAALEYGVYVAVDTIVIDGARAFNAGDPVPTSTVEREDSPIDKASVKKVQTKAAAAADKG